MRSREDLDLSPEVFLTCREMAQRRRCPEEYEHMHWQGRYQWKRREKRRRSELGGVLERSAWEPRSFVGNSPKV